MYTILFAAGDIENRKKLLDQIRWNDIGFTVAGYVDNSEDAIDIIEKNEIDLLVADAQMPFTSGIELARNVRETKPNVQIVFLTECQQFEFVKLAIKYNILEYLLLPLTVDELTDEFEGIKEQIDIRVSKIWEVSRRRDLARENVILQKTLFLRGLIKDEVSRLECDTIFKEVDFNINDKADMYGKKYVVCTIKSIDKILDEKDQANLTRMYNASRIISSKYFQSECFIYQSKIVVIACGTESVLNKFLKIFSKDIVLTTKRIMNLSAYCGISEYYDDLLNTSKAFIASVNAVSYIDKSDQQIVHIGDIESRNEDSEFEITRIIETLEEKLKMSDEQSINSYLDKVFEEINKKNLSPNYFNMCILEMIFLNFKAMSSIDCEKELTSSVISQLAFNKTKQEIELEIRKLSLEVARNIFNQRQKNIDVLAENAMEMIKNEYGNKDMCLNLLSDRLHCSPNYLSSLIKKSKGDSFVNLLTSVRMTKAHNLLIMTNKKIMEISEEVGYGDQHYFSYCFKKYFQVSPNKMRESLGKGKTE